MRTPDRLTRDSTGALIAHVVFVFLFAIVAAILGAKAIGQANANGTLPQQVVQFRNDSPVCFEGYVRTTIDVMPPHRVGIVKTKRGDAFPYFVGRQIGASTRCLDMRVHLEAGEVITLDLAQADAFDATPTPLPADPIKWFGGLATLHGHLLSPAGPDWLRVDGAGYLCHLRGRCGRMLHADVWLHWVPPQPWLLGEILVIASNPDVPDMGEEVPDDFALRFGDAHVAVPGRRVDAPLVDAHEWFGDGQGRALPFVLFWPRHYTQATDHASVGAYMNWQIGARGITRVLPRGNPRTMPGLDALAWQRSRLPNALRQMHTWETRGTGPAPFSGQTGQQWDQGFPGGELFAAGGVGAERVYYIDALALAARPCHHLEANGEQVDPANHPRLFYWGGRPHGHAPVDDMLGKPRGAPLQAHGWSGPDEQHAFFSAAFAAARATGSPCLMHVLRSKTLVYLGGWVVRPDLPSYYSLFQPRGTGWEMVWIDHVADDLEDRALAARALARCEHRINDVIVPAYAAAADDVYCWNAPDPRVSAQEYWTVWQQGLACYGLDLMGQRLKHEGARRVAYRGAKKVIVAGYVKGVPFAAIQRDGTGLGAGAYVYFMTQLALSAMLAHDPASEPARSIMSTLQREASEPVHYQWLAPETSWFNASK